jgi:two-component system, NarL family, nitrate/nitrite response regulator NarL
MAPLRIVLVDRHCLSRKGIAALIQERPGLSVVGEASDETEALEIARATQPDLVLADVRTIHFDGIRALKDLLPAAKVVILTDLDSDESLISALRSGADGYLLKTIFPEELFDMIDRVRRGEHAVGATMQNSLIRRAVDPAASTPAVSPGELTEREKEVLSHVAAGESNGEIAQRLCITNNTVKIHLRNILEKLHLKNRIQVAVYAARQGQMKDPPTQTE